jgi:CelD/BcsL family acetyltransferase involved in cellulose biosynthesis
LNVIKNRNEYSIRVVNPLEKINEVQNIWMKFQKSNDVSYFCSWGWIEAWITNVPKSSKISLFIMEKNGLEVGCFFVGISCSLLGNIFKPKKVYLNASGDRIYDDICIEYNMILAIKSETLELNKILEAIPIKWDEFHISGADLTMFPGSCIGSLGLSSPYKLVEENRLKSPYVDLIKVRSSGKLYIEFLSRNTRHQIRNSLRLIEKTGKIEVEVGNTYEKAVSIFKQLVNLHQKSWKNKGHLGAFSSKIILGFHENLIKNRFENGEIQLLRFHVSGKTIGCLYNFVYNKIVYFYQSGINYEFEKKIRPGILCHYEAVNFNILSGNIRYDFLAGNSQYKTMLSTDYNDLFYGSIVTNSIKVRLKSRLQRLKGNLKKMKFWR